MWLNLNGYAFKESMFCKPWVYIVNESQFIKCFICLFLCQIGISNLVPVAM